MTDPYDTAPRSAGNGQGRVPPHNLQAERALLGAMLLKPDAVVAALEHLKPAHFYDPAHGNVFEAIADLHADGATPDPVTVADVLRQRGQLAHIGGQVKLLDYVRETPATSNADRYAEIVKGHADLRQAIAIAGEIAEDAYSLNLSAATVASRALESVQSLVDATNNKLNIFTMEQLVHEHTDLLERRSQDEEPGIPTGFRDLDEMTGGFRGGEMWVAAAESRVGKSALVGNMARYAAAAGYRVLVVSVEMARLELMDRMLSAETRIPLSVLRSGELGLTQWERASGGHHRLLSGAGLFMVDDPDVTVEQIDVAVRRTRADLFIVDYAQILQSPEPGAVRERQVAAISSALKRMARRHRNVGVVLAAVNRGSENRLDKRPALGDLRESGQLGYDADGVLGLYRDEMHNPETPEPGIMEVVVLKSRNSKAGTIKLRYNPDTQLITDLPSTGATR